MKTWNLINDLLVVFNSNQILNLETTFQNFRLCCCILWSLPTSSQVRQLISKYKWIGKTIMDMKVYTCVHVHGVDKCTALKWFLLEETLDSSFFVTSIKETWGIENYTSVSLTLLTSMPWYTMHIVESQNRYKWICTWNSQIEVLLIYTNFKREKNPI